VTAAFWRAPPLGVDEPFETLWESGLLAYADSGGERLNTALVRQSYAQVATFPPNVTDQALFLTLQREAREA
jgi:hypothetical protein